MQTQVRSITVPAGIGDNLWILQKLINAGEKFNFILPNGSPQRGKPLFDLLPQVAASGSYGGKITYNTLKNENIQNKKKNWADIKQNTFYLCANEWVEQGKRIEGFLPDLETSYKFDYATTDRDKAKASEYFSYDFRYIGIYGSAYANARHEHYNGYGPDEWFRLCKEINLRNRDVKFVIIGADYDNDLAAMLIKKLIEYRIPHVSTIGQPLGVVVEILKRLSYFIGFPSGLSILNETLGKDGLMFYGHKIQGIINTWAHPDRIKSGNMKECLFCPPEKIFDWLKNEYKLFEKL